MTRIAPLLVPSLALFALFTVTSAAAAPPSKNKPQAAISTSASTPQMRLIDINKATLTELRSLPGIGTVKAREIVAGRPYASVDDLKTRKILPKSTYDKIRDRIIAEGSAGVTDGERPDMSVPSTGKH
ncbi:MAG: ComEA family DNA-binding protein [Nitrospiraceae bacterium]